jgi:polysulfide reductase chain B
MVDLDRCIGCKTCIVACRNHHGLIDHEYDMPGEIPYYLRVESKSEGKFPEIKEDSWVVMCQHCKKTPCAKGCEEGAITKDVQTGIVLFDREKCTGCGECVEKCPYKVIQFNEKENYAHKCNLCYDRVTHGLDPVCVETCLTNALTFGEKEILLMQADAAGKQVIKKLSAQSIVYVKTP